MTRIVAVAVGMVFGGLVACGPRPVNVRTGAEPADMSSASVHMTNNLTQAVNVFVTSGGTDIFVGQVPGRTTQHLPVRGVAAGSTVTLKATTVDAASTYTKSNVTLGATMYAWQVP